MLQTPLMVLWSCIFASNMVGPITYTSTSSTSILLTDLFWHFTPVEKYMSGNCGMGCHMLRGWGVRTVFKAALGEQLCSIKLFVSNRVQ